MLIKRLTYTLLACGLSLATMAQDTLLLRDYKYAKHDNPWLTSGNAAALTTLATGSIAQAEMRLNIQKGGHTNYYDAPHAVQATAGIEAFYRLNSRAVAFGTISYDNWTGKDMTGSAFINPERKPFNLVEDSLTSAGKKHRDTYSLSGGMGISVWRQLALGAQIDYTAANYAKYKDLRHKNKLMDLRLTAGAFAPLTSWLSAGANYIYHRNTESLQFGTYGKSEKVYKTLIDYAAFMGRTEQFGNLGFTDMSREMPLFEQGHGASLQMDLHTPQGAASQAPQGQLEADSRALSLFACVALNHATGYYGRRSPYTITYTHHERDQLDASARFTYRYRRARYHLDIAYSREQLNNDAETYRELTNANGATYYEYYDPVETATKAWHLWNVAVIAHLGVRDLLPTWTFRAHWQRTLREQTAYLYPFLRWQRLCINALSMDATRHLPVRRAVWAFSIGGSFQKGNGDPYRDYAFTQQAATAEPTTSVGGTAFLWREYQYLTSPQYTIRASVGYTFLLPNTQLKPHVTLSGSHRKANLTYNESLGCDRTQLQLVIGCTF